MVHLEKYRLRSFTGRSDVFQQRIYHHFNSVRVVIRFILYLEPPKKLVSKFLNTRVDKYAWRLGVDLRMSKLITAKFWTVTSVF